MDAVTTEQAKNFTVAQGFHGEISRIDPSFIFRPVEARANSDFSDIRLVRELGFGLLVWVEYLDQPLPVAPVVEYIGGEKGAVCYVDILESGLVIRPDTQLVGGMAVNEVHCAMMPRMKQTSECPAAIYLNACEI